MPKHLTPTENKVCQLCGKIVTRPPRYPIAAWKTKKYCSIQCMNQARKPTGFKCEYCGMTLKL